MKSVATILLTICLMAVAAATSAGDQSLSDESPGDWQDVPPSVLHQKMSQAKATAIIDREIVRRLVAQSTIENTQANYDVLSYDVRIRVNDTTKTLHGRVKFTARARSDSVDEIQVDLQADLNIDSIVGPSGQLVYSRTGDVVTVALDHSRDIDDLFEFDFFYHGHPPSGGFQAFRFSERYDVPVISSLSEPYFARTWWPCKDRMDDKADSFDIAITVDTALYVASNGTLDSTIYKDGNAHTFYYSVRHPMVSYLFSVAISEYTVWQDEWIYNDGQDTMPIVHAVYPDRYAYSLDKYGITPYMLTLFSDSYGLYPFADEKYGHANFAWGGGMEHQTMTSMTGRDFGFLEAVVAHELAHQWWGNMITCKSWGHIWLNEGWATYSEALYFLAKDGWGRYHDYMNGMAYAGGGTVYAYDTSSVWHIFHSGLSYDKGAWVVHMLRGMLGDSLFFQAVKAYYNSQYQYGAATTEDFRDVFEAATGWELDWFFEDWIYGEYRPYYRFCYWEEPSDTGGYDLFLVVEQTQTTDPHVFRMPVDFFFDFTTEPDDTITIRPDQRRKVFRFNFPGTIANVECDPADWVLKWENGVAWGLRLVTSDHELKHGLPGSPYNDTIETRGGYGEVHYSLVDGALPDGYVIDTNGVISGATAGLGPFTFTVRADDAGSTNYDEAEFTIRVQPAGVVPGDVNLSETGIDVIDLTYLIDYQFTGGPPPPLLNLADVDASCRIDIIDLVKLIDYMFNDGDPPEMGCVD